MRRDLPINRAAVDRILGHVPSQAEACRDVGLAAIAAELQLPISELELDTAEAVERGAAALYLGGFGPKAAAPAPPVARGRTGRGGSKLRRLAKARRSRDLRGEKPTNPAT